MIARGLIGVPALPEESTLVIVAFAFAGVGALSLADLVGHQEGSAP
jgi:hypothetical protein